MARGVGTATQITHVSKQHCIVAEENNRLIAELKQIEPRLGKLLCFVMLGVWVVLAFQIGVAQDAVREHDTAHQDTNKSTESDIALPDIEDHSSAFNRNVSLYITLANADEQVLRELLSVSLDIEQRSVRNETLFAIASRFTLINPQGGLELVNNVPVHARTPMLKGIFTEWCVDDLDGATAAATNLNRDARLTALDSIASVRTDLSEERLRGIAIELGHPHYLALVESESKTLEHAYDPVSAWNILAHDGLNDEPQLESFILAAEAAIEQQGLDVLFHLRAAFADEISYNELFGLRSEIFGAVVDAVVRSDPQRTWAYIETGLTKTSATSIEQSNQNVQSAVSLRDHAYMTDVVQQLLIQSWAVVDPAAVIDKIEQVPYHLQPLACEQALGELARTDPERSIALIQTLKHLGAGKYRALRGVVKKWSETDPHGALTWAQSARDFDQETRADLVETALFSLVLEDPVEAMKIAAAESNSSRLEVFVINELAKQDLDAAIELLPSVTESQRNTAIDWVADTAIEQGAVDLALELFTQLEESSEEEVDWYWFFVTWSRAHPVQLYERMDDLPGNLRYEAARALDRSSKPEFTQEQLDYLRTIYNKSQQ